MNLKHKKHLIFDFDETIDTLLLRNWNEWSPGMLAIIQKYDPSINIPLKDILFATQNIYIKQFGEPINQDFILFEKEFEKDQYLGHQPNAAVVSFIKNDPDHWFYIWSNNHSETINPILKELDLTARFKGQATRDVVALAKPDLDGFRKLGIPVEDLPRTLMVGDAQTDVKAAKAAGIDYVDVDDFVRLIEE